MRQGTVGRFAMVWLLRLLVVGCVAGIALLPPLDALTKTTDTASINSFRVKMNLAADGTLTSRETIDVQMPFGKHGIFRIFDLQDPRRRGLDHPVSEVSVTRDGQPEPWVWEQVSQRTRTAKIGSAAVFLDAREHRYVIRSTTVDALEPGDNGEAVWWWDVIGSGWQMTMRSASVTARLPAAPKSATCVMGDDDPCEATVRGRLMRITVGPLDTHTPVTVKVTFPKGSVPPPPAGDSWLETWFGSIVAALAAALLAAYLFSATRERRPGFPVVFEPPVGVSPAVAAKVLYEDDAEAALQATLYDLAERGVVRLEGDDDAWRIRAVQNPATAPLSAGELEVLSDLGLRAADDTFLVSETKTAGMKVSNAQTALHNAVTAEVQRYLTRTPAGVVAKVCSALGLVAVTLAACVYFFGNWTAPWPLLTFVATLTFATLGVLLDPATGTKHTPEGVELWSRTGGFARFLTTDSSEARFDAAAHRDWYQRYLPWAVMFGGAEAWAKRYEAQGVTTPDVPWMLWSGSHHGQMSFASMGEALTSSISSAVSSYEASQSSSGGGGGGGGSGGGGGGGGSW